MSEYRLARLAVVVVSLGFAFGGFIGIADSGDPWRERAIAAGCLMALLALHLYNCVRHPDAGRPRGWRYTLIAQAVLTGAGMIWFAGTWYGNTGFLAASVLLLIRRKPLAWSGFALILVLQTWSASTFRSTAIEVLYVVIGQTAFIGIALYAVARLTDLIEDLRRTRAGLAAAEITRERLAFASELNDRVGAGLRTIIQRGDTVLAARDETALQRELASGLDAGRTALNKVRTVAHDHHDHPGMTRSIADDLSGRAVLLLGAAAICLMIIPQPVRYASKAGLPGAEIALFAIALPGYVLLYLRNCMPGPDDGRPARWKLTLAAQVVLAVVPLAVFDLLVWQGTFWLAGLTLVLLRGWPRLVSTALLLAQPAMLHQVGVEIGASRIIDDVYNSVWLGERAVIVYVLVWMAGLAAQLRAARTELARTAVAGERLRFARDLHDLLGFSLSVIVLKYELAVRLLGKETGHDTDRAWRELADGLDAARDALHDVEAVATGYRTVRLADEIESARGTLSAAGFEVTGTWDVPALAAETDTVLATVLREGVTNVLRHSTGRRCVLEAGVTGDTVRLRLSNDGAGRGGDGVARAGDADSGIGIGNLRHRVDGLGGSLTSGSRNGTYVLNAEIPRQSRIITAGASRRR